MIYWVANKSIPLLKAGRALAEPSYLYIAKCSGDLHQAVGASPVSRVFLSRNILQDLIPSLNLITHLSPHLAGGDSLPYNPFSNTFQVSSYALKPSFPLLIILGLRVSSLLIQTVVLPGTLLPFGLLSLNVFFMISLERDDGSGSSRKKNNTAH